MGRLWSRCYYCRRCHNTTHTDVTVTGQARRVAAQGRKVCRACAESRRRAVNQRLSSSVLLPAARPSGRKRTASSSTGPSEKTGFLNKFDALPTVSTVNFTTGLTNGTCAECYKTTQTLEERNAPLPRCRRGWLCGQRSGRRWSTWAGQNHRARHSRMQEMHS
jgi:hypothetical protein